MHALENDIKPVCLIKQIFNQLLFVLFRHLVLVKKNLIHIFQMVLSFGDNLSRMFLKKDNYVYAKQLKVK